MQKFQNILAAKECALIIYREEDESYPLRFPLTSPKGGFSMNTLFIVALVVEALFGMGFLIAPGAMLGPFGVTFNDIATTFARLLGSALISFSILLWFARISDTPEFKKAVVYSLSTYYLVSSVLLVMALLTGQMNAMGWVVVGIKVVLLVWFGYFLLK